MKKILFGITSLTLGGAERVLVDLANELSKKYEVTIMTIYAKGELENQLSEKVKLKSLEQKSYLELSNFQKHFGMPLKILLEKSRIYKNKIRGDYDVEIAFLEGPITRLFSTKNVKTKKIAWIHNDISQVFGKGIKAKLKKSLDEKIYSKFETLVFVSKDNLKNFERTYPDIKNNKKVIYNYINKAQVIEKAKEEQKEKFDARFINFVTVARLVPQKGIDRLIKVHSKLLKDGLFHNIYVIGDGPEKEKLQELIKKENVDETFNLLGKKENPYPYIKNADYFCLLSQFEGYGMVLEEAKILGKPIIITNTAAREAVANYENAKIVENTEQGIYKGLKEIIKNYNLKEENNSLKKKLEYNNEFIIEQIEDLIGNSNENGEKIKISVLTPTYNRSNLLPKLYKSLVENSKYQAEIEWLIMDDGSTDDTKVVVDKFIKENKLEIKYFYQQNQGKMMAINKLVEKSNGDLIVDCDSDDYFTENAFQIIQEAFEKNKEEQDVYGLCFLKYDQDGKNMGNLFKKEKTTMFDLYFKEGETGEKAIVFIAEVRKKFKHQLENDERFVTEARMYHKMDENYHMICINQPIMICEYQKEGYSRNIKKEFKENPYGYYQYFLEILQKDMRGAKFKKRLYVIKHFILFSYLTKSKHNLKKIRGIGNKLLYLGLYFFGIVKAKKDWQ